MGVVVYPRLGGVLEAKGVTVADLERRIKERFDLTVDPMALYGMLLDGEPIKRVDLDVVGAVAAALDVPLGDLFVVETSPNGTRVRGEEESVLGPEDSDRMGELFTRQDRVGLSESETAELRALVSKYGRLLHERRVREIARKRGVPEEQVERESAAAVAEALDWWQRFNADPRNREALIEQARQRKAEQVG